MVTLRLKKKIPSIYQKAQLQIPRPIPNFPKENCRLEECYISLKLQL